MGKWLLHNALVYWDAPAVTSQFYGIGSSVQVLNSFMTVVGPFTS